METIPPPILSTPPTHVTKTFQASLITKEIEQNGPTKMLSISRDILAISDNIEGGKTVLAHEDSTIPLRKSVPIIVPEDAKEVSVKVVFAPDTSLSVLTLPVEKTSKVLLGTIH